MWFTVEAKTVFRGFQSFKPFQTFQPFRKEHGMFTAEAQK
jgi:hypothetical protein